MIPPILLVGCGRMGQAMLAGWREQGLAPSVFVDPEAPAPALAEGDRFVASAEAIDVGFLPAAVVLAVKPQFAASTLPAYARHAGSSVFVSIMAGRTVAGMRAILGAGAAVVRAMPNTPAAIRRGISAAYADGQVDAPARALAERLLAAVGEVAWVEDEASLDAVTAVSGSGPAYVFLLAELLETAAREQGLDAPLARRLARATIAGSGALLAASGEDAATLRRGVTSPKGTTERALGVLMAPDAWPRLVSEAVAAAAARSRELAG